MLFPPSTSCFPVPSTCIKAIPSTAVSPHSFPFVHNQLLALGSVSSLFFIFLIKPWVTKTPAHYCWIITNNKRILKENKPESNGALFRFMLILLETIALNLLVILWLHAVSTRKENADY